jgi:ATP-dependent exoDNAse (exonuclease V) alpha subunit
LVDRGLSPNGGILLTTNAAVTNENELVNNIRDGVGKGRTVLSSDVEFHKALLAFEIRKTQETGKDYKLSGEQIETARNILMHGDVYQGVQGDAGTGKTAALEMVREVSESKGWVVMGIATTSSAAKELEASSGISSQTVAGFLNDRDNALRLANLELVELRGALAESVTKGKTPLDTERQHVEVHKLSLKSDGIDFGTARYAFDNERGEVFRSPDTLRNQLGNFLLDVSSKKREELSGGRESLADRLRERATAHGSQVAGSLGRRLTTYEKVGTVESIAARDALHLKQDNELSTLQFKVGAKQAEISNLQKTGNKEGRKSLLVMDESTMTGVRDATVVSRLAKDIEARVVFQGDVKQHSSVPAGRAFEQALQAGMHKSTLLETRRFDNATQPTKQAVALMNSGRMAEAIAKLDRIEVDNKDLHRVTADRYLKNFEELKSKGLADPHVGVVTVTNEDRKAINKAVHDVLADKGLITGQSFAKHHLDNPKLTEAEQLNAGMLRAAQVDHLAFRKNYKEIGVKKNDVVHVKGFDASTNTVTIINAQGKEIAINPKQKDYFTPMKMEVREYGVGDKVEARANIHFEDKKKGRIDNGERGVITSINERGATIKWGGSSVGSKSEHRELRLDNDQLRMVDLSYARTTFKEQGATTDREIIAISAIGAKVFNEQAAYVAGTRAKNNAEIVTSDYDTMLKNSGKAVSKTTAIDIDGVKTGRQGTVKDITKENTKIQDNANTQDKSKEKEKSQQQIRNNQQSFILE